MRLLFVTHRYPPDGTAGVETYVARLAAMLRARGHDLHVWTAVKDVARIDGAVHTRAHDGIPVTEVVENLYGRAFRSTWDDPSKHAAFGALLDDFRPDVVHVHHLLYQSVGLLAECARRGIAVVYTLHDFWLGCARFGQLLHADGTRCETVDPGRCGTCLPSFAWRQSDTARRVGKGLAALRRATGIDLSGPLSRAHRRAAADGAFEPPSAESVRVYAAAVRERNAELLDAVRAHVDLFVLPSVFQAPWFAELGLSPERLRVVPTGLDWDGLGSVERTPDPGGRTRFLFLGTQVPHKAPHLLVDAFERLAPELRARATLALFGPDDNRPSYAQGVAERASQLGAEVGGRLDRAGVRGALGRSDVLVVPSLWLEVRPLVMVEAFAAGLRVVASDLGGMAELLGAGIPGRTFAVGDADALSAALAAEIERTPDAVEPAPGPSTAFPTWESMLDRVLEVTEEARRSPRSEAPGR